MTDNSARPDYRVSVGEPRFGGENFKPSSAPKMLFCTAGLERFPKCPP